DRGSILILDKRVIQKSYGQVFLKSLPECRMVAGPTAEVFKELEDFLKDKMENFSGFESIKSKSK
ncbi:MAG: hypothetical protein ACE5HI_12720, partial [bacterium]